MRTIISIALISSATVLSAESLDAQKQVIQRALSETQDVLVDPSKRQQVISNDPNAAAADNTLRSLTQNPQATAQAYQLTSEIMGVLVQKHGADVDALQKALEMGLSDPASFIRSLPEGQQARIRELASQIEKNNAKH